MIACGLPYRVSNPKKQSTLQNLMLDPLPEGMVSDQENDLVLKELESGFIDL